MRDVVVDPVLRSYMARGVVNPRTRSGSPKPEAAFRSVAGSTALNGPWLTHPRNRSRGRGDLPVRVQMKSMNSSGSSW